MQCNKMIIGGSDRSEITDDQRYLWSFDEKCINAFMSSYHSLVPEYCI